MLDVQTIRVRTLPSVPFAARQGLPGCAAIYFVLNGQGTVLYVGRSVKLAHRWRAHHQAANLTQHGARRIAWLVVEDLTLLDAVEAACIAHFEPICNTLGCSPPTRDAAGTRRLARVLAACQVRGSPVQLSRLVLRSRYAKDALLTPDEVCEIVGMSRAVLEPLIRTEEIRSITTGKLRRIPRAALDVWLQERLSAAAPPQAVTVPVTDTDAPQAPARRRKRQAASVD